MQYISDTSINKFEIAWPNPSHYIAVESTNFSHY